MRLTTCLYKLKGGDYHHTIQEIAGIAQSTISRIIVKVSELITEMLWEEHVEKHFPNTVEEFKTAMVDMASELQFPFGLWAIDSSLLFTKYPVRTSKTMSQYYNFKTFYSKILLAVVDARYRLIWVSVGAAGNIHDSTYFESADLWNRIKTGLARLRHSWWSSSCK